MLIFVQLHASVMNRSGLVEVQGRTDRPLLAVIAEMLRSFLSHSRCGVPHSVICLSQRPASSTPSCHGQVRLAIRPIETEVYPDFVDLGLVLPETDEIGPASSSMIYDRRSRTWHAD